MLEVSPNFKVLCIHVDQNLAEIPQGYFLGNCEIHEKNQLVSMKHLLCPAAWAVALRIPVKKERKHLWEDKEKQPNIKPGTCQNADKVVMGMQL